MVRSPLSLSYSVTSYPVMPCLDETSFCALCLVVSASLGVPAGLPPRGGDVAVYVFDNRACPLLFILFLCLFLPFMALSTVFHSINSPDNSPLSHSVLPVLFLPYWSFQLSTFKKKSPLALI